MSHLRSSTLDLRATNGTRDHAAPTLDTATDDDDERNKRQDHRRHILRDCKAMRKSRVRLAREWYRHGDSNG
ncbi:hypothetical protein ABZS66_27010 [Dactylosporangium sp. NPDC005572]|uniref:hypothetical protein n=1 Tax=Dactylosporangium sp. NPDC005572 TaxID=3156889 RepID=UPI0033B62B80